MIVSVYYRLDSFGFLAHPDFATDPTLGDMNAGIQDQTEALRWVQKHIAAFGGDPDQVTIDGQSAGGSSIEIHLVAPQQEGLFHGAIAQSVYRTPLPSPEQQVVSRSRTVAALALTIFHLAFVRFLRWEGWMRRFRYYQGNHGVLAQCYCERPCTCSRR